MSLAFLFFARSPLAPYGIIRPSIQLEPVSRREDMPNRSKS